MLDPFALPRWAALLTRTTRRHVRRAISAPRRSISATRAPETDRDLIARLNEPFWDPVVTIADPWRRCSDPLKDAAWQAAQLAAPRRRFTRNWDRPPAFGASGGEPHLSAGAAAVADADRSSLTNPPARLASLMTLATPAAASTSTADPHQDPLARQLVATARALPIDWPQQQPTTATLQDNTAVTTVDFKAGDVGVPPETATETPPPPEPIEFADVAARVEATGDRPPIRRIDPAAAEWTEAPVDDAPEPTDSTAERSADADALNRPEEAVEATPVPAEPAPDGLQPAAAEEASLAEATAAAPEAAAVVAEAVDLPAATEPTDVPAADEMPTADVDVVDAVAADVAVADATDPTTADAPAEETPAAETPVAEAPAEPAPQAEPVTAPAAAAAMKSAASTVLAPAVRDEYNRTNLDYRRPMPRPKVRGLVIDFHNHLLARRHAEDWFEAADHFGMDRFVTMAPLEEAVGLARDFGHRLRFIAVPKWGDDASNWADKWRDRIEAFYNLGSRIAKFHASPGTMVMRGVRLDAPVYKPLFAEVKARGMAIMTHVGDPDTWYNGKYDPQKFGTRDDHYRMWEDLLEEHRGTTWIGAHLGGNPENLPRLQRLLDKFPDLWLDCSATRWMVREISARREPAREFFIRNADRILFGSDQVSGDDRQFDFLASRIWCHRKLWETAYIGPSPIIDPDLPPDHQPTMRGLALPDVVLQKVYHDNPTKLLAKIGMGFE